ncbi:MAG: hypothetical protein ACRD44_17685 [Bryobacteraceae bacterium]
MAAAALTSPVPAPRFLSRWIVGRGVDLTLVIGGSLAGYLYLLLFTVAQAPASFLWWFWSVGFDGTHLFGTASRTYFDQAAMKRDRRLFIGSLLFFFSLGPAMVLAGWKLPLAILVGVWAYYHVLRQHWGFVMLYKIRNRDMAAQDTRLDSLFLTVMLVSPPLHRYFVHSPEELGIPSRYALAVVAPWFETAMWAGVAWVAGRYVWRQYARWRAGEPLNAPKLMLLAAVAPLHWLTFAFLGVKAAVPTVTIVHNLQYHALIWFHNRQRYGDDNAERAHGRIPAAVTRSLLIYAAAALAFSLLYRLPGFHLGRVSDLAFGFFCGFGMTHYYLDSRIWRVRQDPELGRVLGLQPAGG